MSTLLVTLSLALGALAGVWWFHRRRQPRARAVKAPSAPPPVLTDVDERTAFLSMAEFEAGKTATVTAPDDAEPTEFIPADQLPFMLRGAGDDGTKFLATLRADAGARDRSNKPDG